MGKNNYDDLADLFGPKGFHDFDGDGHIDDLEASFMLADIADEIEEFGAGEPAVYGDRGPVTGLRMPGNGWSLP